MQSFPFTSQVTYDSGGNPTYDRAVDSEVFRNVLKNYYNNGVFALNNSECFLVEAPTDESMVVTVLPGSCMINGATAYDKQETELTLSTGGAMDRIDTIVLRFNDNVNYRNISLAVVEGTPATTPVAPTLTRSDSIFELGIANILVPANSTAVSTSRITDTRQDSERCGYVSAIQELDVTDVFNQFQNALNEYLGMMSEEYDEWLESFTEFSEEQQAAFMEWFENLQYVLDGDVAGHLQNQIDYLKSQVGVPDVYNPERIYEKSERCIVNNVLYRCTQETIGGGFDLNYWRQTTVLKEIDESVSDAKENLYQEIAKGTLGIDSGLFITASGDHLKVTDTEDILSVHQTVKFNFS